MSEGLKGTSATSLRPQVPRANVSTRSKGGKTEVPGREKVFMLQNPKRSVSRVGSGSSDEAKENRF